MTQQTAVKWILIELQNKFPKDMYNMYNGNQLLLESLFLQAKAMEKEQIIQSSRISYLAGQEYHSLNGLSKQFAEQYYNETYPDGINRKIGNSD